MNVGVSLCSVDEGGLAETQVKQFFFGEIGVCACHSLALFKSETENIHQIVSILVKSSLIVNANFRLRLFLLGLLNLSNFDLLLLGLFNLWLLLHFSFIGFSSPPGAAHGVLSHLIAPLIPHVSPSVSHFFLTASIEESSDHVQSVMDEVVEARRNVDLLSVDLKFRDINIFVDDCEDLERSLLGSLNLEEGVIVFQSGLAPFTVVEISTN